jgi:hypothetical protein
LKLARCPHLDVAFLSPKHAGSEFIMIELAIDRTETVNQNGGAKNSSARENLTAVKIRSSVQF